MAWKPSQVQVNVGSLVVYAKDPAAWGVMRIEDTEAPVWWLCRIDDRDGPLERFRLEEIAPARVYVSERQVKAAAERLQPWPEIAA